ncbi:MAG: glycosyltransferase, partial [Desulfobacteraceae bacterium]|nr:glycosyltransferase [Desulfobacteraceae bacterium]
MPFQYLNNQEKHLESPLKNKRVIFITHSLELGGAERQALNLAQYLLHKEKAEVHFWAFRDSGEAAKLCDVHGIPWRIVPLNVYTGDKRQLKNAVKLWWVLWRTRPDIILSYDTPPNMLCGLIWRATGARLCIWNERNAYAFRLSSRLDRWASRLTPWFISNSHHGANTLIHVLGVRPERIQVIYNGIVPGKAESSRAAWRKQLGINDNCFLAV